MAKELKLIVVALVLCGALRPGIKVWNGFYNRVKAPAKVELKEPTPIPTPVVFDFTVKGAGTTKHEIRWPKGHYVFETKGQVNKIVACNQDACFENTGQVVFVPAENYELFIEATGSYEIKFRL